MYKKEYMEAAVAEARNGIESGHGGPFGAVIVKNGEIIASGHNRVVSNNDSTCHGEIDAIRKAEQKLGTFDLSGCQIYTTSEPCPMCLSAILWANIEKVYYGCNLNDNEKISFRDIKIENLLKERAKLKTSFMEERERNLCLELFDKYNKIGDKKLY